MDIVGAYWTRAYNVLEIRCDRCGQIFAHRCDRWTVRCDTCGNSENLGILRDRYADDGSPLQEK